MNMREIRSICSQMCEPWCKVRKLFYNWKDMLEWCKIYQFGSERNSRTLELLNFSRLMPLTSLISYLKVARYSFSGPIPPKFEHKLRRHKQSFGKIAITVVLDKDENLLWSGLQQHWSCHSNEMTLLPILLVAVYLGTGNCSSKVIHESFFLQ